MAFIVVFTFTLFLKNKPFTWIALFLSISSLANMKSVDGDYKQIMTSFFFAVFGIYLRYFGPQSVHSKNK